MQAAERLFVAIREKDAERVRTLLQKDPALARATLAGGLPPLQLALYFRARPVVEALLAAGVEPSPFEAAILGDAERLREAIARDAGLLSRQGPDGAPLLHLAAHFGHAQAAGVLVEAGAPLDLFAGGSFGNTALHAAAAGGQPALVEILLRAGAKVDLPDRNGFTPLHVAAANGLLDAVKALLARGASPSTRAKDGRTPVDVARERGHEEVAGVLAAAGP